MGDAKNAHQVTATELHLMLRAAIATKSAIFRSVNEVMRTLSGQTKDPHSLEAGDEIRWPFSLWKDGVPKRLLKFLKQSGGSEIGIVGVENFAEVAADSWIELRYCLQCMPVCNVEHIAASIHISLLCK